MSERWTQDEIDADMFGDDDGMCPAGSEECDFECPYRAGLYEEGHSDE